MRCSEGNDTIRDQLYAWLMGNYTRPYIAQFPRNGFDPATFGWSGQAAGVGKNAGKRSNGTVSYYAGVPYLYLPKATFNNTVTSGTALIYKPSQGNQTSIVPWAGGSSDNDPQDIWGLNGQLWVAISGNDSRIQTINCQLYNASVDLEISFTNHVGVFSNVTKKFLNRISPVTTLVSDVSGILNRTNKVASKLSSAEWSYLAFFRDASSYIVGVISRGTIYDINNSSYTPSTSWDSRTGFASTDKSRTILSTSLAFSSQIHDMMERMTAGTNSSKLYQASEDIRNISLSDIIEEFTLNSTLSILSSSMLW
jgi:hypothetical protein